MIDYKTISWIDGHAIQADGLTKTLWILASEVDVFTDIATREACLATVIALEKELREMHNKTQLLHEQYMAQENKSPTSNKLH